MIYSNYNRAIISTPIPRSSEVMRGNHEVEVGDKFRLLGMGWEVNEIHPQKDESEPTSWFKAVEYKCDSIREIDLSFSDADKLDWIVPEVTLTKAQAKHVKSIFSCTRPTVGQEMTEDHLSLFDRNIDSLVKDGE